MNNPSDIENSIQDVLYNNIDDYSQMSSVVTILYDTYPDFPVLKFFFHKLTRLSLTEIEAKDLFDSIIRHCAFISSKLEENSNFYVGMLDYIIERNRIIFNPVFINLYLANAMDESVFKDSLTGAYNEKYLEQTLKAEINRSQRNKLVFSILTIDIDKFAQINNNYGYHSGNRVLVETVERINRSIRAEDTLIRSYGDRFFLISPSTDYQGAISLSERIYSVFMMDMIRIDNRILNITLSIGIVQYPLHCENYDAILMELTRVRYKAKETGKNSVVVSDLGSSE